MKKKTINPVVAVYLSFSSLFAFALSFFFATYVPFLVEKGMNLWQVNVINSFFMLFIVLAEMPTGSFADRFGRHRSITLSCFLLTISFLIYYFSGSFWFFVVAEIVGAIGHTFVSGAAEAWLVDSLKARNEFHLKEKVFREEAVSKTMGMIFGCVFGSWLGDLDLSLPWLATASFMFLAGIFSLFFIKENYNHEVERKKAFVFKDKMQEIWFYGFKDKKLLYVMSFGMIFALAIQALNMQWTIFFKDQYQFSSSHLGYLFVLVSIFLALGAKFSALLKKYFSNESKLLVVSQLFTALAIIAISQFSGVIMVSTLFLLHEFGRGLFNPIKQGYINNLITSERRATLLSLDSMFLKLGAFIGLLISGALGDRIGIINTWLTSGIILFLGIVVFIIINKTLVINKN
jgi:MFS family permease